MTKQLQLHKAKNFNELKTLIRNECPPIRDIIFKYLRELIAIDKHNFFTTIIRAELYHKIHASQLYLHLVPVCTHIGHIYPLPSWSRGLTWCTLFHVLITYNAANPLKADESILPNSILLDTFDDFYLYKIADDLLRWVQENYLGWTEFTREFFFMTRRQAIRIIIGIAIKMGIPGEDCPFSIECYDLNKQ